jgi:hypothetical protein
MDFEGYLGQNEGVTARFLPASPPTPTTPQREALETRGYEPRRFERGGILE